MFSEQRILEQRERPRIVIRRSGDAPESVKANPFYDPEFWGRAYAPDDMFLPDSDEALSFALAAHEIGHLVNAGARDDAALDHFPATRAEEARAWEKGWPYLSRYLREYFGDHADAERAVSAAYHTIRTLAMDAVDMSEGLYLPEGSLRDMDDDAQRAVLQRKRTEFFQERGADMQRLFSEIKKQKTGIKPDWDAFVRIVTKAVADIIKENES